MMTLGEQFGVLMNARAKNLVVEAGYPTAEEITAKMKELTLGGDGFGEYMPGYKKTYAKVRERKGLQSELVTLRFKNKRIERTTQPTTVMGGAEIGFVEGGKIFKYHQDGVEYKSGTRTRTIFPKSWEEVPYDIYDNFIKRIVEVMNGK